jgi:beta-lactamase superfamily II metal-dependent hydrolase
VINVIDGVALERPAVDQGEVSLFGPRFGEAVACHLGNDRWLLVDSCLNDATAIPRSLEYLDALGVATSSVVAVVVSHWDTDHIAGMAEVVERCDRAEVFVSAALLKPEFLAWVLDVANSPVSTHAGVREFHRIVNHLHESGRGIASPVRANQRLYRDDGEIPAEIWSLSPSATAEARAAAALLEFMPEYAENPTLVRPFRDRQRNEASTALWVRAGSTSILLGGDLETRADVSVGWKAVVASTSRPQEPKSYVFKVAHHGSSDAHDDGVWSEMLQPEPVAILTPWSRGGHDLPTEDDLRRLCDMTPNVFATSLEHLPRPRRDPAVERSIREATRARFAVEWQPGHVQVRFPCTPRGFVEEASVGLDSAARHACG